jgi:streptogramin lyase/mono/diheme cytochrome c family protein
MNSIGRSIFTVRLPGLLAVIAITGMTNSVSAAEGIPGTATLSGSVTAEQPFVAAQVYARNHDKSMLYMVYSNDGRFKTVNLMPGGYEIWAEKGRLKSEHQWMRIDAGASISVNLPLRPGPEFPLTSKDRATGGPQFGQPAAEGVELVPYDELYPAGRGRDIAEATCIQCHGQTYLPTHQKSKADWLVMIDVMLDPNGGFQTGRDTALTVTPEEREILANFLTSNFGPESPVRGLKIDVEYPLDEDVLSKGQFIEYLLPLAHNTDLYLRSKNLPGRHRLHGADMDFSGNVWAANGIVGVVKMDPRTGQWSHYPYGKDTNNPEVDMYGVAKGEPGSVWSNIFGHDMTVDSNENVYWMEYQGQHVGRLNSKTGKVQRFPMDPERKVVDERGVVGNIRGHSPHLDAAENLWFTAIRGNKIGMFDRETEDITLWEIPTPHSFPYGIDLDRDENVWFAELLACKVGKFDPDTEEFTEYPSLLTTPCSINRLTVDGKGIIWYSLIRPGLLGKLDPKTEVQTEYDILPFTNVSASMPYGIIADRDDRIWFGDGGMGGALVTFDPDSEKFTYYPLPRQTDNPNLDTTRDGAIVYTTRASRQAGIGIFYPDVSNMREFGAFR